jgi:ubiquinone/menaquinone biosynthesis C-methylase UbiE
MRTWLKVLLVGAVVSVVESQLAAQDASVRPGVNDPFRDPDVPGFQEAFETESREVFAKRAEIVQALELKPGETVADIGAGTGLFTRLMAKEVGPEGKVVAVEISQKFLDHIQATSREAKLENVATVLGTDESVNLEPNSIDVAFVCDTYHHFEFPQKTLASIHKALKPEGRLIVIDFRREEGKSRDWVLNHVRAGQEVVEQEITEAGFEKTRAVDDLMEENYLLYFKKKP